jgi:hypothetical protein
LKSLDLEADESEELVDSVGRESQFYVQRMKYE